TPKKRQQSAAKVCPRPVVPLLVSKGHPLVPLVLKIAGEKIAAAAARAKPSCVTSVGFIAAVIKKCRPSGVASLGIGIEDPRQRKTDLHKPTLSAHRTFRR